LSARERVRRIPAVRLAAPAVLVALGLTVGTAAPSRPTAEGPRTTADVAVAPAATTSPQPIVSPAPSPSALPSPSPSASPPAPAPVPTVAVPAGLTLPAPSAAIPKVVLEAYVNAAKLTKKADPACRLTWQVLAGIGYVESDNARSGGSADPGWDGVANPPIYGPLLNGQDGFARIPDSDDGRYDGNSVWDRAVGPMQFLPSTWAEYAADGNHDGIANPQDIFDATLAAADYLCANTTALNHPHNLIAALHSYNHSYTYVREVLTAIAGYLNIKPGKLGINGLPKQKRKRQRLVPMSIVVPGLPPQASSPPGTGPAPSPSPSPRWTPPPTPAPTPSLPQHPHR